MNLNPGEQVVWKDYSLSRYRRNVTIALVIIGVLLTLTVLLAALGIILIAIGLIMYFLLRSASQYVVTNQRAFKVSFGKIVKEVPLNTPGLVISLVNNQFIESRLGGSHVVQDVAFLQNGIELLRFSKVHKGDELIVKLRSMGFTVT
ncbi:hypothetical protein [Acidianus sp. HS-5]|uniref:hypothetical protein n=1 Tax=Acidianus sp. HS-5 TaxID=2886040 RepID=UPI001F189446|nr:hypothetical protein [Acidianus sp. HS-5]BDC18851.1 hypothetical protein HS5_17410 [Acidianus sp. HS-5]